MVSEFFELCDELDVRYGPFETPISLSITRHVSHDRNQPSGPGQWELQAAVQVAKTLILHPDRLADFQATYGNEVNKPL